MEEGEPGGRLGRLLAAGAAICVAAVVLALFLQEALFSGERGVTVLAMGRATGVAGQDARATETSSIIVDYPQDGSIFPPDMIEPVFLWRDAEPEARSWRIEVKFADRTKGMRIVSAGEGMKLGEIDARCVSTANKPPFLTAEQAAAHTWKPEAEAWAWMKKHSTERAATVEFTGMDAAGRAVSHGRVSLTTSRDPVGAPIFYRDVPLMPFESTEHVVQPLAPAKMSLIAWRLRDV